MRAIILVFICFSWLYSENVLVDTETGLMWEDDNRFKTVEKNWADAKNKCNKLTLNGHWDWRLPNIKELQSIVDINNSNPSIKDIFTEVKNSKYWSSTEEHYNYRLANVPVWTVDFSDGSTYRYAKSEKHYVRCVRDVK